MKGGRRLMRVSLGLVVWGLAGLDCMGEQRHPMGHESR